MLQGYGGDRVQELADGSIELRSTLDKGWRGTRAKTSTTAEFPGTPVHWDDRWFEVTFVRRLQEGGCVYVMRPWREQHPIRNPSTYDEPAETTRRAERARTDVRRRNTTGIALAGLFIGHIPAHAQREVESEYGFSAINLSLLSMVLPFVFVAWVAARLPVAALPPPHASPAQLAIAFLLFGECVIRFLIVMKTSSPCGSVLGLVAYEIWRMTTRTGAEFEKRATVRAVEKLRTSSTTAPDAATSERDAYELREPFLALLSAREQTQLRATYGFDPRKHGMRTAVVIGVFSALGVHSSVVRIAGGTGAFSTWSSLVVAIILLAEQVRRLTIVHFGAPAGSILGALVRPWCRKVLNARPTSLKAGSVEALPPRLPDIWDGDDDHTGR